MTVAFDQTRADAQVHELGGMITRDANYAQREWRGIALVIELDPRTRMYGFVYDADDWEAETPDDFDLFDTATALADTMAAGGKRWQRCLVQISRAEGAAPELKIAFDYDGSANWSVTPANHAEMVETLRP